GRGPVGSVRGWTRRPSRAGTIAVGRTRAGGGRNGGAAFPKEERARGRDAAGRGPGGPGGRAGVALADRDRRSDAGRRRCHAVLPGADGVLQGIAALRATSGLERLVGLRIPRPGREPDGGLLPPPPAALWAARGPDGPPGSPR